MKNLQWCLYDLSGCRFVVEKLFPPDPDSRLRPPSSFLFWFVGIYVATYSFAYQLYENRSTLLLSEATGVASQAASNPKVLNSAGALMNRRIPVEPHFWNPLQTGGTLLGRTTTHSETISVIRKAISLHREHLAEVDLSYTDLSGLDLTNSNLRGANLTRSNLTNVDLRDSNMQGANLHRAIVKGLNLRRVDLAYARLDRMKGWQDIDEIRMANVYGVTKPEAFISDNEEWGQDWDDERENEQNREWDSFWEWLTNRMVVSEPDRAEYERRRNVERDRNTESAERFRVDNYRAYDTGNPHDDSFETW